MLTLWNSLILGIVQGITEFLPISSSGHLIFAETFFGLHVEELKSFDIILHLGTLTAIAIYFWRDFLNRQLWPYIILGSIPAVIVGLLLGDFIDANFRAASTVALVMIFSGTLYTLPIFKHKESKKIGWKKALLIGLAQCVAFIPGVSRSGITIFSGTQLGLPREEAARFSFLLGAVAIAGGGFLTALDLHTIEIPAPQLIVGFFASFTAGLLAIHTLIKFLKHHSLRVFGIYLLCVGITTTILFATGTL